MVELILQRRVLLEFGSSEPMCGDGSNVAFNFSRHTDNGIHTTHEPPPPLIQEPSATLYNTGGKASFKWVDSTQVFP
jgi:hypothetical protein